MKEIQLQPHQSNAIEKIQQAVNNKQKHIVVEMPIGCGNEPVLAKTVEMLSELGMGKILVATNSITAKRRVEEDIFKRYYRLAQITSDKVVVKTEQWLVRHYDEIINECQFIIFFYVGMPKAVHEIIKHDEKTFIVFSDYKNERRSGLYNSKEIVFSYGYKEAVSDGVITPAMDINALEPAIAEYSLKLLEQFGCAKADSIVEQRDGIWDMVMKCSNQTIWVECKVYKSQVVSPAAATSLLNTMVMKRKKQKLSENAIILLIVPSRIPSFQKNIIFDHFRIVVWDIANLVYYSKNDSTLLRQLSQITYFPIDSIKGQSSAEAEKAGLNFAPTENKLASEAEKEEGEIDKLLQRLSTCQTGQRKAGEYEEICEAILRFLFEASYFNRLTSQHKTNDTHFRMDLIGSLKINQSNEESMHPLWQMIVQHYNSHFVVFEFKNYKDEIDQNLIYITEKYLFDAALRNVAFIVSRKGFSKAAKFAAEGCLKEHGKLIISVTDADLIKMLELKSDKAADYLLDKLEDFLMGISK